MITVTNGLPVADKVFTSFLRPGQVQNARDRASPERICSSPRKSNTTSAGAAAPLPRRTHPCQDRDCSAIRVHIGRVRCSNLRNAASGVCTSRRPAIHAPRAHLVHRAVRQWTNNGDSLRSARGSSPARSSAGPRGGRHVRQVPATARLEPLRPRPEYSVKQSQTEFQTQYISHGAVDLGDAHFTAL